MKRIVLGLGGNRGDRADYLRQAITGIRKIARVLAISPIYESDALLPEGAPDAWAIPYYNLALSISTDLEPVALLGKLKALEKKIGRQNAERWAPREIDIDILWIDGGAHRSNELVIPHPELTKRPFALLPLLDLVRSSEELRSTAHAWLGVRPDEIPFRTRRVNISLCELVGVLNLTPDSFSDGGNFSALETARAHALKLIGDGAAVLDLGGESTRPGATPVTAQVEWQRIEPVIRAVAPLLKERRARLSIDTRHPEVAKRALDLGQDVVDWINDVSGLRSPEMIDAVRGSSCKLVVMHSLSVPADPRVTLPPGIDPVAAVGDWFREKLTALADQGIAPERVILDPGVGFGKTPEQSLRLLRGISELRARGGIDESGARLMIGHSRKSFISAWRNSTPLDRDLETAAASALLTREGVEYLRVHDVQASLRAILTGVQLA